MSCFFRFCWFSLFMACTLSAQAANSITGSLGSTAAVVNSCIIQSAQSISLGSYAPTSGVAAQGAGQITLKCTKGDAVTVVPVSGGQVLMGPKGSLSYALYTNVGHTLPWGAGSKYAQINFDTNLYFSHQVTLGAANQSQCINLAAGGLYVWNPTSNGLCWYGWTAPGTSALYSNGLNVAANTLYVAGTYVAGGNNGNYIIAPTGTTRVGTTGFVYNTLVSLGSGQGLSGSSTGSDLPMVFNYYANIPAGQDVTAGVYADTVVVQVSF